MDRGFDQRQGGGEQRGPGDASSPGLAPGKRTLTEQLPVQRSANGAGGTDSGPVREAATQGVASKGGPLPHADRIQRLFGRHDISGVETHIGGPAAVASRTIGAEAYAIGHHVAFASPPSPHTTAHEAAHVVQQRGGVQLKGGIGESGGAHEQHANAVADAVVQGKSAETLLDRYASSNSSGGGSPAVQRKPDNAPSPQQPEDAHVDRLIQLLVAPAAATVGQGDAYTLLSSLGIPELLATMEGVADCGYLPQLHARVISWTNPFTAARLISALYAVEFVRVPPAVVATDQLKAAGKALDLLPQDQQIQIVEYVLHHRGAGVSVTEVFEGALAMRESKDAARNPQAHGSSAMTAGTTAATETGCAPAPVEPGPWAPPGEQPIPFYIGNEAHAGIAFHYQAKHRGDRVEANSSPISSILRTLTGLGHASKLGALADAELGLMPDITNLTRLHLYEIKPLAAEAAGAAKAATYVGLFAKAGVAVALGPTTEPGVEGGIPAPGGVYVFWSPQPGVIVYQYRRGKLVPVPVLEPEPARERRWKFELRPMTPQQQAAVATITVGGMLLLIAMILLAPVGA